MDTLLTIVLVVLVLTVGIGVIEWDERRRLSRLSKTWKEFADRTRREQ